MYSIHDFGFVRNFNDAYLELLAEAVEKVRKERKEAEIRRRKEWIADHYWSFKESPHTAVQVTGKRPIVAIYNRYDGVRIGTAYPINGDVYDYETGIAVAYAKALGERIPDYI